MDRVASSSVVASDLPSTYGADARVDCVRQHEELIDPAGRILVLIRAWPTIDLMGNDVVALIGGCNKGKGGCSV